ncbi:MAG: helix-turn-helix transcriptional regulator [Anaerolineae bacterium]
MQATRWGILEFLKEHGQATVDDLAQALGLAPITIRHHLAILEKDDLVTVSKMRRQRGRPSNVYSLTEAALELFPKKYHLLADRLLAELKALGDEERVSQLFDRMAEGMAAEHTRALRGKSLEEKITALVNLLNKEGFLAQWEREDNGYLLKEYSCPYYYVGQRHPEVCRLDLQVITAMLGAQVERRTCMINGDDFCTYRISPQENESRTSRLS